MNPPWQDMRAAADLLELLRDQAGDEPAPLLTAGMTPAETLRAILDRPLVPVLATILRADADRMETVAALVRDQVDWTHPGTPESRLARLVLEVAAVTA